MRSIIHNSICPYCWVPLIVAENQPNSRSVEHLIPNTILTKKRTKKDGDFYACRSCNSRKGHIDYVLSVVAKTQSKNEDVASAALTLAVYEKKGRAKRFLQMANDAIVTYSGIVLPMPISRNELLEYILFLGKGQYFRKHKRPYDETKQIMIIGFSSKIVMSSLEKNYSTRHISNPFSDLKLNK